MTDNFLFISVYIGLVIAAFIKGIPKNPFEAKVFLKKKL
jgi:hypothetical protein